MICRIQRKRTSKRPWQPRFRGFIFPALLVSASAVFGVLAEAQLTDQSGQFKTSVTVDVLQRRIAEVEAASDMQDDARTALLETYHKALNYLNEADSYRERAEAYDKALKTAQAQAELIRNETEAFQATDPETSLTVGPESTREQLEQAIAQEEADLAGAKARGTSLDEQISFQRARLGAIDLRLDEVRRRLEETVAALATPVESGGGTTSARARGWVIETRYAALAAEVASLDLERRSHPLRLNLLEVRLAEELIRAEWIEVRVAVLSELINRRRQGEMVMASAEAAEVLGELKDQHPKLFQLAQDNADLSRQLSALVGQLDTLEKERSTADRLIRQVEADHRDAEAAVTDGAQDNRLGSLLLELREYLPDVQVYRNRVGLHGERIASAEVRRLRHQTELRYLADPGPILAELEAGVEAKDLPRMSERIHRVLEQRQELLTKALEVDEVDLRRSRELAASERELLKAVDAYNEFLSGHLLWMQTVEPMGIRDLANLPAEVRALWDSPFWSNLKSGFVSQLMRSIIFWMAIIPAVGLWWKRRAIISRIEKLSPQGVRADRDSFTRTIRTLLLTLAVSAPLPLVLAALGWHFKFTAQGGALAQAVGSSLLFVALHLFILLVLRAMCLSQGLFIAHFGWPPQAVDLFRAQLERYTWIFVLSVLVGRIAVDLNPSGAGGTIARLAILVYAVVTALFYMHVLHPQRGLFAMQPTGQVKPLLSRLLPVAWLLLMAAPLALAGITLMGYLYSAGVLLGSFQKTQWLIAGLILLFSLASRALLVTQRRLAYQAAVKHRREEMEAKRAEMANEENEENAALQAEEPEVDLEALSDDTRELLKIGAFGIGLVGLSVLWSPVLPALTILDDVTLWYRSVTVDGEIERIPITLASVGLALIYGFGTQILARRLPGFLEISLIRAGITSGERYTATTLTRYTIIAVGAWLVFNTLGARWSQFQWLVAALGVGIGFGLQEIVANFISGLMMLFERPLRVGDIVTVGEVTGVVTRIQIRATTIRDWDHRELVVPNREFITGRLLNWTLADRVTRVTLEIGVAYGTDVELALKMMREAAAENERVMEDPAPILTFDSFGDNALILSLRAYVSSIDYRMATTTALLKSINQRFEAAGISIAFPQRHLHLEGIEPFRVRLDDGQDTLAGPSE